MSDRTEREIRDLLRRDAEQVPVPTDMWAKIADQVGRDRSAAMRADTRDQKRQLRHALALVTAAAAFWAALGPVALEHGENPEAALRRAEMQVNHYDPRFVNGALRRQGLNDWAARPVSIVPMEANPSSVITIR